MGSTVVSCCGWAPLQAQHEEGRLTTTVVWEFVVTSLATQAPMCRVLTVACHWQRLYCRVAFGFSLHQQPQAVAAEFAAITTHSISTTPTVHTPHGLTSGNDCTAAQSNKMRHVMRTKNAEQQRQLHTHANPLCRLLYTTTSQVSSVFTTLHACRRSSNQSGHTLGLSPTDVAKMQCML